MRKLKVCRLRPAAFAAVGILAVGVVAIGETRVTSREVAARYGIDINAINQKLPAGQRVVAVEPPLESDDFVIPPQFAKRAERWERLPAGVPLVHIEQMDDASIARGEVAAGFSESDALVFLQNDDSGYFAPIKSGDAGTFEANQLILGGGFVAGGVVTGYSFTVFNSSGGPSGPADIDSELWTGDPLGAFDTACGAPVAIAGTGCSFTDVPDGAMTPCPGGPGGTAVQPCPAIPNLTCKFAGKPALPAGCDRVWLVYAPRFGVGGGCRVGWRVNGAAVGAGVAGNKAPDIGVSDGFEFAFDCGQYNVCTGPDVGGDGNDNCANPASGRNCGTCCNNGGPLSGAACDDTDGAADCSHSTFCTDGTAELATVYSYHLTYPGYYASYLASVFAPSGITITAYPVGNTATGETLGATISGNRITMAKGGRPVYLDYRVSDWDPTDTGKQLRAYQVAVDPSGYTSGLAGTLTPRLVACTDNSQCDPAFAVGSSCDFPTGCGGVPPCFCTPMYIDIARGAPNPWAMAGVSGGALCAVDHSCVAGVCQQDYRGGCSGISAANNDPAQFPAGGMYLISLALDVPAGAKGDFTVGMKPPNADTSLVDQASAFYGLLGLVPAHIEVQTGQCCNLSVFPFVCLGDTYTANECAAAGGSFNPNAICDPGVPDDTECGCLQDNQCGDADACTIDRCLANTCVHTPVVLDSDECCDSATARGSPADINGGGPQCHSNDGNVCTDDSCSAGPGRGTCVNTPDATNTCNDNNPCTYDDNCRGAGVTCEGLNVNDVDCIDADDCLTATGTAFDCILGKCFCTIAPQAGGGIVVPGGHPENPNCFDPGDKILVDIGIGPSANVINGAQLTITYDPDCLNFNSIVPAGSVYPGNPYVTEIEELVDEAAGRIFYAVGVNPFGGVGLTGNAPFAQISFTMIGTCTECTVCVGGGNNPQDSLLVDDEGQPVFITPGCSKGLSSSGNVHLTTPDDTKVNVDCDFRTATVTWAPPAMTTDCPSGQATLTCEGVYPDGSPIPPAVAQNGGEFPVGTSTVCCEAVDRFCLAGEKHCWTVTVNEETTLDVTIQLSPIITGELDRCIIFQLYSDCVQGPFEFCRTLHFGGIWDHVGHFTDQIKIPDAGQWVCITAQDQLHTLRACDFLACVNGDYEATFKGDPFFGGNWLIGGNLDAWKKFNPNASHNVIDILDFGQYVANHNHQVDPDTPCPSEGCHATSAAHADINGDGIVNSLDYAFVVRNFLASSKDCCCPGSVAGNTVARTEVSVQELRAMDMADLIVADLNGDGLVNADDMNAFMAGNVPIKGPTRTHGGGLRSGK